MPICNRVDGQEAGAKVVSVHKRSRNLARENARENCWHLRNFRPRYSGEVKRSEIATVPNAVTVIRLAMLPWFVSLIADGRVVAASFVLGFLGASDWVDGYLARRLNQVSELGKVLDPVADRLVFFVGVSAAIYYDGIPLWFGIAILVREGFVAVMMLVGTALGMERFPVTNNGKRATFALLWAVPWILIGTAGGPWVFFQVCGWCIGVPGLMLSYVTAVQYVPVVRAHLRRGDYREGL
jgi:cardiolipin synthase